MKIKVGRSIAYEPFLVEESKVNLDSKMRLDLCNKIKVNSYKKKMEELN